VSLSPWKTAFPKLLDVLGLHSINPRHLAVGIIEPIQKMIEFRMESLGVPMLGALNEDGHHPCRESGDGVPIECIASKKEPKGTVSHHDEESCWT
jgi:hypothetical protein